jgi:hypothetical protein
MPVILATPEAEVRASHSETSLVKVNMRSYLKKNKPKTKGLGMWLKW